MAEANFAWKKVTGVEPERIEIQVFPTYGSLEAQQQQLEPQARPPQPRDMGLLGRFARALRPTRAAPDAWNSGGRRMHQYLGSGEPNR
jgi:hypothetical protein